MIFRTPFHFLSTPLLYSLIPTPLMFFLSFPPYVFSVNIDHCPYQVAQLGCKVNLRWLYLCLPAHMLGKSCAPRGRGQNATDLLPRAHESDLLSVSHTHCPPLIIAHELGPRASYAFGGTAGPSLHLPGCYDCERMSEIPFPMEGLTHAWFLWTAHLLTKAIKTCERLKRLF